MLRQRNRKFGRSNRRPKHILNLAGEKSKYILRLLRQKSEGIRMEYGILALAACIAVPLKLLVFYKLIGVAANFFLYGCLPAC